MPEPLANLQRGSKPLPRELGLAEPLVGESTEVETIGQAPGVFAVRVFSYSKSIDDASQTAGTSGGGFSGVLDARNMALERGRSDWDRRHVFVASFSLPVPIGRGKRLLRDAGKITQGIAGGWQLSGTSSIQSGLPFTVLDANANQAIGESLRPNRITSGNRSTGTGTKGVDYPWFTPTSFQAVPVCASRTNCSPDQYGFVPFAPGNSGRNILDGPGLVNVNLGGMKNFVIRERNRIQFRWEVFNIANHPNFLLPNRNFNQTGAGIITGVQSGTGGSRVMQFALRCEF